MEVLYHIKPSFVGIFPYIGLTKMGLIYGRYLQFKFLKWPLIVAWQSPQFAGATIPTFFSLGKCPSSDVSAIWKPVACQENTNGRYDFQNCQKHIWKSCDDNDNMILTFQVLQSDPFQLIKWPFLGLSGLELMLKGVTLKNQVHLHLAIVDSQFID